VKITEVPDGALFVFVDKQQEHRRGPWLKLNNTRFARPSSPHASCRLGASDAAKLECAVVRPVESESNTLQKGK
jgi:hypothetical protein